MSNEFKSWEEYTPLEQAQCTFWDMYKDAHNFRPRHIDTSSWTLAQFEQEFVELSEVMKANDIQQGIEEAIAIEKFERRRPQLHLLTSRGCHYQSIHIPSNLHRLCHHT